MRIDNLSLGSHDLGLTQVFSGYASGLTFRDDGSVVPVYVSRAPHAPHFETATPSTGPARQAMNPYLSSVYMMMQQQQQMFDKHQDFLHQQQRIQNAHQNNAQQSQSDMMQSMMASMMETMNNMVQTMGENSKAMVEALTSVQQQALVPAQAQTPAIFHKPSSSRVSNDAIQVGVDPMTGKITRVSGQ